MDIRRRESKTEASSREKRIYEKDQVNFTIFSITGFYTQVIMCFLFFDL